MLARWALNGLIVELEGATSPYHIKVIFPGNLRGIVDLRTGNIEYLNREPDPVDIGGVVEDTEA